MMPAIGITSYYEGCVSMILNWTLNDMPDLAGKTAVVTGGNSGIGYSTGLELARKGATVVIAARNKSRGESAVKRIKSSYPAAKAESEILDLSDLSSVDAFAGRFLARHPVLDILVNNAGVMSLPKREVTRDGFEMQVGTNHLGHFALTARLLPALKASADARVVTVSSMAAKSPENIDDYMSEASYKPIAAYGKSKVSNLLFANELARRMQKTRIRSISVHPSVSATNLFKTDGVPLGGLLKVLLRIFALSPERGAMPTLYAATSPGARTGAFYAPALFKGKGRRVRTEKPFGISEDRKIAAELWSQSEIWTGLRFDPV
jgi:NAD(P)-dependent dehydrogenase (short-subunit alcohol dehydrogenase family)